MKFNLIPLREQKTLDHPEGNHGLFGRLLFKKAEVAYGQAMEGMETLDNEPLPIVEDAALSWDEMDAMIIDMKKQASQYKRQLTHIAKKTRENLGFVGAYLIYDGTTNYNKWKEEMYKLFGEEGIKPEAKGLFSLSKKILKKFLTRTEKNLPNTTKLLELWEAGKARGEWYDFAKAELFKFFGDDTDLMIDFIAATSPQRKVKHNLKIALNAFAQYKTGEEVTGEMPAHTLNLQRVVKGQELSGPKVGNFARALKGDVNAVAIDSWMLKIFGFPASINDTDYRFLEKTIQTLAKKLGTTPRILQAALWFGAKLHAGKGDDQDQPYHEILGDMIKKGEIPDDILQHIKGQS